MGGGSGAKTDLLTARIAAHIGHAVPLPTGGGKSVCYQIPALMMPGITLVVSPLISLMRDQVLALKGMGIPAAYINSTLTPEQMRLVYRNLLAQRYKIVYVAPERLDYGGFSDVVSRLDISFLAVDEAHCISQWGQDFRPSYLRNIHFIESLPRRPVVGAFTATATDKVWEDVERLVRREVFDLYQEISGRERIIMTLSHPKIRGGFYFGQRCDIIEEKNGGVYIMSKKRILNRIFTFPVV